jgi:CheY-like chemotaxis protein
VNFAAANVPRILVIDDNRAIHHDFRMILCPSSSAPLLELEAALFGPHDTGLPPPVFQVDSAYQGHEGLALLEGALREGRPYWMAFVDVRMPPGWDGVDTISRLWQAAPELQVVLCTAHSDYSWSSMITRLPHKDRSLGVVTFLPKPYGPEKLLATLYYLLNSASNTARVLRLVG